MKKILRVLCLCLTFTAAAQDFELDLNFGNDSGSGYLGVHDGTTDFFRKVIASNDDLLYYVGYVVDPTEIAVYSTLSDGTPNPAFGDSPLKRFAVSGPNGESTNVLGEWIALQDDKLIIGARIIVGDANVTGIALIRLNLDGTLDNSFGTNGSYLYAPTGIDTFFGTLEVTASGEIFIGGRYRVGNNSNHEYMVQKLTPNGVPDSGFADNGVLIFDSFEFSRWISAIHVLDNGQIMLAGTDQDEQLFLLNADGTFDGTFGNSGVISTQIFADLKDIEQFGDSFFAIGTTRNTIEPVIFKFTTTGMDLTFGTDGVATSTVTGFMEDAFIDDNGTAYFTSNLGGFYRVFKTETANGFVPFEAGNFELFENAFNISVLYGITQLSDETIIGAGIGLNLVADNTGNDMYAIKLTHSTLSAPDFEAADITIYPNPVHDLLQFDRAISGEVRIYSILGEEVFSREVVQAKTLDVAALSAGIYLLHLRVYGKRITKKMVKK
ncbi:hypothetical protein GCM10009117_02470 [Gangjinia marincola]|uniref:Secretion system C-terminal sorting domain-containing protein n=1 Tax=Gangjinia marincola TaxID=578463 RepID=A0ABN1MDF0_9FLAO